MLPHPFTETLPKPYKRLEGECECESSLSKDERRGVGMFRWAAIASSRAAMRLAVASSRPLIVHSPMAPVGATTIVSTRPGATTIVSTRPLLLSSIARLPSDFSATRGYARGRSKPISSEEEEEEDLVDDDEELDGDEDFDDAEDFEDEDDSDDGEYGRSDRD